MSQPIKTEAWRGHGEIGMVKISLLVDKLHLGHQRGEGGMAGLVWEVHILIMVQASTHRLYKKHSHI